MTEISEQSRGIVQEFLDRWWADLAWKVAQTTVTQRPLPLSVDQLYDLPLGLSLRLIAAAAAGDLIAAAAEGEIPDDEAQQADVARACWRVLSLLFGKPGDTSSLYPIPIEWWDTPIGDLVARALAWAWGDNLVTLREAAEMSGRTVKALSELVRRGTLQGYRDPREPNPQRRTRVRRSDVQALPQVGRSGPRRRPG